MDPAALVDRALAREPDLGARGGVWIVAVGKAAQAMAGAAVDALRGVLRGGVIIAPASPADRLPLDVIVAEHPEPGTGSLRAGQRALAIARDVPADSQLLVLLSGGASSLMAAPAADITLEDKRRATAILLKGGADIHSLNTARKHLSAVKGGWLAASCGAPCRTFAISDVVGDDLSVIGSGPTMPDASTYDDAWRALERFAQIDLYPASVVAHLRAGSRGARAETPKPGDPRLARSTAEVIGGRGHAMRGAESEARARGYHVVVVDEPVVGEARLAGEGILRHAIAESRVRPRPLCVISSGETTVPVKGRGKGGRNQELALAAVDGVAAEERPIALASVGTDGVDGPTDAAGALIDSTTLSRAQVAGLREPSTYLDNNDSYSFHAATGDLIRTGPTGTNVGDIQIILLS